MWTPPKRRRLWLMRHGAVDYFTSPGADFSSPPLSPRGVDQARLAGEFLASVPIDRLVVSGVPRALQTANLALPGVAPVADSRWREIEPGPISAPNSPPDARSLQAILNTLGPGLTHESCFLGGESFGQARTRVVSALTDLLADPSWHQCLVVAHSVTIRLALLYLLDAPLDSLCRLEQDTGCMNLVEVDPAGHPLVRLVNFTPPSPSKDQYPHSSLEELLLQFLQSRQANRGT